MSSEIILENFETKSNRVCLDEGSPRNVGDEQSNFIVSNIRDELTGNVHQLRRIVANRGISTLIKMISPSLVRLTLKLNAVRFSTDFQADEWKERRRWIFWIFPGIWSNWSKEKFFNT